MLDEFLQKLMFCMLSLSCIWRWNVDGFDEFGLMYASCDLVWFGW